MSEFYDQLADLYHLIFLDWAQSIELQATQLCDIIIFQVWDFEDQVYDLSMYFVVEDGTLGSPVTHVMRTKYNAVGTDHLLSLMREAGFISTERIDGRFYQPVLVGRREA